MWFNGIRLKKVQPILYFLQETCLEVITFMVVLLKKTNMDSKTMNTTTLHCSLQAHLMDEIGHYFWLEAYNFSLTELHKRNCKCGKWPQMKILVVYVQSIRYPITQPRSAVSACLGLVGTITELRWNSKKSVCILAHVTCTTRDFENNLRIWDVSSPCCDTQIADWQKYPSESTWLIPC